MHQTILPPRLTTGDTVRVIAPARSRALIMEHDNTRWINERFAAMGLTLTFGAHVDEDDRFRSSSIESPTCTTRSPILRWPGSSP